MKKVLMTLVAALVMCGSIIAQDYHYTPRMNMGDWDEIITYVQINGVFITTDDQWAQLEVASFVGDECRGRNYMLDETDYGDLYPEVYLPVNYANTGETVTYRMFDHSTEIEYAGVINIDYVTGDGDQRQLWDGEIVFINFTPMTFTKEIVGYTGAADHYYLIASPVGTILASNVENLTANNYDFYSFNQSMPAEEWNNLKNVNTPEMEIGKGYLYANSQDVTLSFTGTPLDPEEVEEYPVELDYDAECTTVWKGYNLIGNPYAEPAFLDREYLRLVDGEYEVVENYLEEAVDMIEGVFVQAEEEDEVATFSLGLAGPGFGEGKKCVLNVTQGRGFVDRAVIHFGEGHQMTKVQFNSNHSKLYIPQDGEDYAVVRSAEMGEMPVNFKAGENGNYMLSVNPKNVEFNYLHLIDNLTGADVDLLVNPSYSFEANTTDYASRFKLVFATGANDENFAFFSNGSFVISNEGEATLQVIDVNGRILNNETISGSANVHVNAAPGVYMLRLINGNNVKVQKVIVK